MKLHTVFISYNRLELTKRALASYLETVTIPHTVWIADNASTDGAVEWIREAFDARVIDGMILFKDNHYPGYACNQGFAGAPGDETHLHRADNDFSFLPGWCEEVKRMFEQNPRLGQLGLRTDEEELFAPTNVGGNCVIRRELFDQGLRYDERPWPQLRVEVGAGWSEDSLLSGEVSKMGYEWDRVERPCIVTMASGDWKEPYYQRSYGDRGIVPHQDDPTLPGTR